MSNNNLSFKLPFKRNPFFRVGNEFLTGKHRDKSSRGIPEEVRNYCKSKNVFLSTKQVPSAMLIRAGGSHSLYENLQDVLEKGFPLLGKRRDNGVWETLSINATDENKSKVSGSSVSFLSKLVRDNQEHNKRKFHDIMEEDDDESQESSNTRDFSPFRESTCEELRKEYNRFRIFYEDPFKHFKFARILETKGELDKLPKVNVWFGDVLTLKDKLPKRILGKEYTGKSDMEFCKLSNIDIKMSIITKHTHWGYLLSVLSGKSNENIAERDSSRMILKRLRSFLLGDTDPYYRSDHPDPRVDTKERISPEKRARRLLELICTVDGMFQQRFLAFPDERWDWDRFDRFIIGNIDTLLTDEFLDFTLKPEVVKEVKPFYTLLKEQRKIFKDISNRASLKSEELTIVHPWLEQNRAMYMEVGKPHIDRDEYLRLIGILSQSRCCGTPPPIVVLKTKYETLISLSTEDRTFTKSQECMIKSSLDTLFKSIPDDALSGLATHATIRVTTAACWESTVAEGGTASAINELVWSGRLGKTCKIRDLESGVIIDQKKIEDCTLGEYIFWRSLEEVLSINPDDLGAVWIVMVADPGKARSVTKGRACLKIVYDVVNKLCARLLIKGVESSKSGMEKSAHAWQFFKTFFREESAFRTISRETIDRDSNIGQETVHIEYEDIFCSSTDYSTASDEFMLKEAELLGDAVMGKVGIPSMLRGIVKRISFKPRKIYFKSKGILDEVGEPVEGDPETRFIWSMKGLLMGDPLTKVILHMQNILVREVMKNFPLRFALNSNSIKFKVDAFIKGQMPI